MVNVNPIYNVHVPFSDSTYELADTPSKWCSVTLYEVLNKNLRLDAGVFDIEAIQAREIILNGIYGAASLYGDNGLIEKAFYPGRFKRIYCDAQNGEGFYLPSQMTDIYPKPEKYISSLTHCNIDDLRLKQDTLLLTRSGTIGTFSYVSQTLAGLVFSDDVIRISFKNLYDLGYVYTFFKSKIGNLILRTNGYGAVITHIEPEHLTEIEVPNAPINIRKNIHKLIKSSYILRDESNQLLNEANKLLVKELQFPPFDKIGKNENNNLSVNTYSVKLTNLNSRLDASYHIPIVNEIFRHLKTYSSKIVKIGDNTISKKIILPGRFKRIYVEEGHGKIFIGGKQITELDPVNKKYLSIVHHRDRINNQLILQENMVLITCSGTIGKVAIVAKHWENWTASQHIIRIVPSSKNIAGYLYAFLSSEYAYPLITRYIYGSVVDEIDNIQVSNIPVPILKNQDIQKQINELVLKANKKRYEAYKLEQEALRIMNEEVIYAK